MRQDFLGFEITQTDLAHRAATPHVLAGSHTTWLVVGKPSDNKAIIQSLCRSRSNPYRHFFLSSRDGRRRLSEGDLVIVASDIGKLEFRAFVYGCSLADSDTTVLAKEIEEKSFVILGSCVPSTSPVEMVVLGFTPAGRREKRWHSGRNTLERVFDSLQCRAIIDSPTIKERLSEGVLRTCPRPVDPLISAVFSRFCADAMASQEGLGAPAARAGQIVSMYRSAELGFTAVDLRRHAVECARRARMHAQGVLPGIRPSEQSLDSDRRASGRRSSSERGLGFVARQCVALRLQAHLPRSLPRGKKRPGHFHDLGRVQVQRDALLDALHGMTDNALVPVVAPQGKGRTFELDVVMTPRVPAFLGLDGCVSDEVAKFETMRITLKGDACFHDGFPAKVDQEGRARLPLTADRVGRHRVEIIVLDGTTTETHPVKFDLEP